MPNYWWFYHFELLLGGVLEQQTFQFKVAAVETLSSPLLLLQTMEDIFIRTLFRLHMRDVKSETLREVGRLRDVKRVYCLESDTIAAFKRKKQQHICSRSLVRELRLNQSALLIAQRFLGFQLTLSRVVFLNPLMHQGWRNEWRVAQSEFFFSASGKKNKQKNWFLQYLYNFTRELFFFFLL